VKRLLVWVLRLVLALVFLAAALPYVIPRDFSTAIPEQPYPNSEFFKAADGTRLHGQWFEAQGAVQGKILMVHGLGASTFSYRNNAPFFQAQGYHVLAVDLPAFGYSSKARGLDHSQAQRARYLWAWMDVVDARLEDASPWHLVGHSMGGSTVLALTEQAPQRVATMNLIAGAITNTNSGGLGQLANTPLGEWVKVALRYFVITENTFTSTLESAYNRPPTREDVLGYLRPLQTAGTPAALIDFVRTARNTTIQEFGVRNVPLNLLWGAEDSWVHVDQVDIIAQYAEISALVVFENEGHCVHETDPSFNQELLKLLVKSTN
jgi:pimeloyl-ACP methyl ester carboxylesterase